MTGGPGSSAYRALRPLVAVLVANGRTAASLGGWTLPPQAPQAITCIESDGLMGSTTGCVASLTNELDADGCRHVVGPPDADD